MDVLVRSTFRSDQGALLSANWAAPASLVAEALGCPVATGGSTVTINVVAPGDVWGDRVNEIDIRVAKVLRLGRTRMTVGLDVFNVVNSAAVLTYNQNFSTTLVTGAGSWRQPQSVLNAAVLQDRRAGLIWKDQSIVSWFVDSDSVRCPISTRSPTPGLSSIRAWGAVELAGSLGSSHLIGRAATTMNHFDIRGSKPHDSDSSGAASL